MAYRRFTVRQIRGKASAERWEIEDGAESVAISTSQIEAVTIALELARDHCSEQAESSEVLLVSDGTAVIVAQFVLENGVPERVAVGTG